MFCFVSNRVLERPFPDDLDTTGSRFFIASRRRWTSLFSVQISFQSFYHFIKIHNALKSKCIGSFHCCCFCAGSLTAASFVTWFRCYLTNVSLIWAPAVCSLSSSDPLTPANHTIIHWPSPPPLWWDYYNINTGIIGCMSVSVITKSTALAHMWSM